MKHAEKIEASLHSRRTLSLDQVKGLAPSAFARRPRTDVTKDYVFVPTDRILSTLIEKGFEPMEASQTQARSKEEQRSTKHMIKLRPPKKFRTSGLEAEVILINAHNRTTPHQMYLSFYRPESLSTLVVSEYGTVVRHFGKDIESRVVAGVESLVQKVPEALAVIDKMKAQQLTTEEQLSLAKKALAVRWPAIKANRYVDFVASQLLLPRRAEDSTSDLWAIYNRIHENLLRGGTIGISLTSKLRKVRAVVTSDTSIAVSAKLWQVAMHFVEKK